MYSPRQRRPATGTRTALDRAESALIVQYGDLTRLAYLTLPVSLSRHRRILLAHGIVQRALPGVRGRLPAPRSSGTAGSGATEPAVPEVRGLRQQVVRAALARERRPRGWPAALPPPGALVPQLPMVWGLRLFPAAGGAEDMALGRLLATAPADARAAFLLHRLDGLSRTEVAEILSGAGVRDPESTLRACQRLDSTVGEQAETLLRSREFDACFVQTRPTDLLRRRRRLWCAWGTLAALLIAVTVWALPSTDDTPSPTAAVSGPDGPVPGPRQLTRAPRDTWADTSRVDFTAWPARGGRVDDDGLLARALSAWARPSRTVRTDIAPGTPVDPPPRSPQLLFAGDVDHRAVVLFHDAQRIVRYSEPLSSDGPPALAVARADDADVTTAAAVVVARGRGTARFLTAPWISEAQTRDLLRPDTSARRLRVGPDGITAPVPSAAAGTGCSRLPVLQLRSSSRIVEKHAFLLTDLGDLSPVHLTYTPLPDPGAGAPPSRQPREATGPQALLAWARLGCGLREVRGSGVRAVNAWDFADQDLPEHGGRAVWSCVRASSWRGPGDVVVRLRTPAASASAPARVVARARSTAACSRFGQHVLARTRWRAGSGHWYVVAAGSRAVVRIKLTGDVAESRPGRTLAVRAAETSRTRATGVLANGDALGEVGGHG